MNPNVMQAEVMIREAARLLADAHEKEYSGLVSDLMATAVVLEGLRECEAA